jgi:phosphohistidine phosphatase SixA
VNESAGAQGDVTLVLLRHAWAGDRERWEGDDRRRPLDERGQAQALALVDLLAPYPADRLLSSPYLRCVQTLEPLAAARGLRVEPHEQLAEKRQERDGLALVRSLAGADAIVCTHGGRRPWEQLVGDRYRKREAVVLDGGLRVLVVLPPPA